MGRLVKWLGLMLGIVVATAVGFGLYSHFLVDYSLENLELALSATEKKGAGASKISSNVYEKLVSDMALEEAAREDLDLKNLALLEVASRSIGEALNRAGYERANLYLKQATETKIPDRQKALRFLDEIYNALQRFYQQLLELIAYFERRMGKEISATPDVSSLLLLAEAEEKEKRWELNKAAELYRNFLKFYPDHPEHAFVKISLSHVLIKQARYTEAERLLRGLQVTSTGVEEYQLAANLLRKITEYKKKAAEIRRLETLLSGMELTAEAERMKLKLGLLYLQTYSIKNAQAVFKELESSEIPEIRQKSKFYKGWIYKLQSQYDQGAEVLLNLMQDKELGDEMGLGLNAQLADIYYKKKEPEKSLAYYQKVSNQVSDKEQSVNTAQQAWTALAGSEAATIAYFDANDPEAAKRQLRSMGGFLPTQFNALQTALQGSADEDLHELAFSELRSGRLYEALDLFKRILATDRYDAWSHSGLAVIYVLMADIERAREHARRGHDLKQDTFTTSALAYVLGYAGETREAVQHYRWVLQREPDYLPAIFNLSFELMNAEKYEEALELLRGLDESLKDSRGLMRSKILNNMGFAKWRLGHREEAEGLFEEAIRLNPDFKDAKMNLDVLRSGEDPTAVNFQG